MEKLLDALYNRLILRDAFGKVLPGLVWLSALVIAAWGFDVAQRILTNVDWLRGLTLIGAGWVMGFAVQGVGKLLPPWLAWLATETEPDFRKATEAEQELQEKEFSARMVEFDRKASDIDRQQVERFITIKDATGNSYVALALAILTLAIDWGFEGLTGRSTYPPALPLLNTAAPLLFAVLAFFGLRSQHRKSSLRQKMRVDAVLAWARSESAEARRLME